MQLLPPCHVSTAVLADTRPPLLHYKLSAMQLLLKTMHFLDGACYHSSLLRRMPPGGPAALGPRGTCGLHERMTCVYDRRRGGGRYHGRDGMVVAMIMAATNGHMSSAVGRHNKDRLRPLNRLRLPCCRGC
jgi:hypothetical protein